IPTGLSRLAGQTIRLVQRLRLSSSCFGICGWGRPPVDLLVVSPTSVSGQHDRDGLTRPARAVRDGGRCPLGPGRARTSGDSPPAAGILPRPAGNANEKARRFMGARPTPPAGPAGAG